MKTIPLLFLFILTFHLGKGQKQMNYNPLNAEEQRVILQKGTERPFTGKFNTHEAAGFYTCKQCNAFLYRSEDKFKSNCGWPSFDAELPGAVERIPDRDGRRTEIVCAHCKGHLGHVFIGERYTEKNTRHCVNSISMDFVPAEKLETALFAAGCFWGVEHLMKSEKGVVSTRVGYTGGTIKNPAYREVTSGRTGHAEAVEVVFDPTVVTYESLLKAFFEIHDFTQVNRQGPDVGEQYRSEVFYTNSNQKEVALSILALLRSKGYDVATALTSAGAFYDAEEYHQRYYDKTGKLPYCHIRKKIF